MGNVISQNPAASEWAAERGDKWRANVAGMEAMLSPVDEPLIGALRLDAAVRIAEVGCGGGATARAVLARAPGGSVVHGYDISPGLIEVARGRIPPGEPRLAFSVADMATAAPPQPYQRLLSRFGMLFFGDPAAAFANLARWLVPGGRFAFAAWGQAADNPWIASVRDLVAGIVALPPTDPDAPGAFRYADADKLLGLLARAGLDELEVHDWRGRLAIGGGLAPAAATQFALAAFSSYGEMLAQAGPAAVDEARRALTAHFARHERDGVVVMDACVHLVTGARR